MIDVRRAPASAGWPAASEASARAEGRQDRAHKAGDDFGHGGGFLWSIESSGLSEEGSPLTLLVAVPAKGRREGRRLVQSKRRATPGKGVSNCRSQGGTIELALPSRFDPGAAEEVPHAAVRHPRITMRGASPRWSSPADRRAAEGVAGREGTDRRASSGSGVTASPIPTSTCTASCAFPEQASQPDSLSAVGVFDADRGHAHRSALYATPSGSTATTQISRKMRWSSTTERSP